MGKSYSKQEDVIIAQNGANSASTTSLEQKIELYGLFLVAIIILLLLITAFIMCRKARKGARNWARKQAIFALSTSQIDRAGHPQQAPEQQYA